MITISVLAAIWLLCGIIAAELNFAYFQRKWASIRDSGFADDRWYAAVALWLGPISLVGTLLNSGIRYGWLWPWGEKARREARIA